MPTTSPAVLAQMIESYTHAHPGPTPLTPIIHTLFDASLSILNQSTADPDPNPIIRRFLAACSHLPPSISHAGISGPLSGPHALNMQIRKSSVWIPSTANESTPTAPSLADEMRRTAIDRQRRREFIHWARLHAVMLEMGPGIITDRDHDDSRSCSSFNDYTFLDARAFSELVARDAVWEADEVQWVAGVLILRALIRTAATATLPAGVPDLFHINGCTSPTGRVGRSLEYYGSLLRRYEGRWKEIKDEARQAIVAVSILFASFGSNR